MKHIFPVFWIALIVLAACSPAGTAAPATQPPSANSTQAATPAASTDLAGTRWALVSFGKIGLEKNIVAGSTVTLELGTDGKAGGSGGCNSYGGTYQAQGNKISFSGLVSTLMACADQKITNQEGAYLVALQTADRFEVSGNQLTIFYDGGQGALHFTQAA